VLFAGLERGHPKLVLRAAQQVLRMGAAAELPETALVFARRARREALRVLGTPEQPVAELGA
jgi:hypothetical protein